MNRKGRRGARKQRSEIPAAKTTRARTGGGATAAYHFNLATSHQTAARWSKALVHFARAIELGIDYTTTVNAILGTPVIAGSLHRLIAAWPRPLTMTELFGPAGIAGIKTQALLPCMLKSFVVCEPRLEHFMTRLRALLLKRAGSDGYVDGKELALYCALAQQCFINEYVFSLTDDEIRDANTLRETLSDQLAKTGDIPPLLIATVAAYFPLHRLTNVELLLNRK